MSHIILGEHAERVVNICTCSSSQKTPNQKTSECLLFRILTTQCKCKRNSTKH